MTQFDEDDILSGYFASYEDLDPVGSAEVTYFAVELGVDMGEHKAEDVIPKVEVSYFKSYVKFYDENDNVTDTFDIVLYVDEDDEEEIEIGSIKLPEVEDGEVREFKSHDVLYEYFETYEKCDDSDVLDLMFYNVKLRDGIGAFDAGNIIPLVKVFYSQSLIEFCNEKDTESYGVFELGIDILDESVDEDGKVVDDDDDEEE